MGSKLSTSDSPFHAIQVGNMIESTNKCQKYEASERKAPGSGHQKDLQQRKGKSKKNSVIAEKRGTPQRSRYSTGKDPNSLLEESKTIINSLFRGTVVSKASQSSVSHNNTSAEDSILGSISCTDKKSRKQTRPSDTSITSKASRKSSEHLDTLLDPDKTSTKFSRKYTIDGLPIYSEKDLDIGFGGHTAACPFDCDCCY